ncbi:MAG TPA: neocarzinostatin apoprotein domain-containing protein [Acidimicrobiia bacterium]|nr:neocarzinostatin apoprotein domain-containing protein [Acidimicrobiia bacterium]
MILLVVLAVALVGGVAVLGLGGASLARDREGLGPAVVLGGGAVALVVVVLGGGAVVGVLGGRGGEDPDPPATAAVATSPGSTTVATAPAATSTATSTRTTNGFPGLGPDVVVRASVAGELPAPTLSAGDLADGDIVPVVASGFGSNVDGRVRQCAASDDARECTPGLPVRFDAIGTARFLFPVSAHVGADDERIVCGPSATCTLEVSDQRNKVAMTVLVFGAPAPPPPEVRIEPSTVADGAPVVVTVRGLAPRERVRVVQCAANDDGRSGCGAPGSEVDVVADASGAASAELPIRAGRVGARIELRCSRETTCGVAVVHADGFVRAAPLEIRLSAGPSADYDGARLLVGLLIAVVLIAAAVALGVRTDWRGAPDPFA